MKTLITLLGPAFDWTLKHSIEVALLVGLVFLVQKALERWLTPRLRYALSLLALVSSAAWRYVQWCRLVRQGRLVSETRVIRLS